MGYIDVGDGVGDNYKMLMTVLAILITNIQKISLTSTNHHKHRDVTNIFVANWTKCHQRSNNLDIFTAFGVIF